MPVQDELSDERMSAGEGIDPRAVVAWMRLARVYHKVDRRSAETFRLAGLSVAQFDVLAQVGAMEGCAQQELADRLLVTKGNITQLLDRMEQRGWIERRAPQRGRGNRLYLTTEGRAMRDRVLPDQERWLSTVFAALSSEERVTLIRLLRKLDRQIS